jgi:hypothetical protein
MHSREAVEEYVELNRGVGGLAGERKGTRGTIIIIGGRH